MGDFFKKLWAYNAFKTGVISTLTAAAMFTGQYFGFLPKPADPAAPAPVVAPAEK